MKENQEFAFALLIRITTDSIHV